MSVGLVSHIPYNTVVWVAMPPPFTHPKEEDIPLLDTDPAAVRADAYDKEIDGVKCEPVEELTINVPEEFASTDFLICWSNTSPSWSGRRRSERTRWNASPAPIALMAAPTDVTY